MSDGETRRRDFIREIVRGDLAAGRTASVVTRFPPEPNGYLHIGHAKSICLNFGIAGEFGGRCNLRFDDTNPEKEEEEYIEAIREDVSWLGHDWGEHLHFASDYFETLYEWAVHLVVHGLAYVDDQTADEIRETGPLGMGGIYVREDVGGSALGRLDAVLIFEFLHPHRIPHVAADAVKLMAQDRPKILTFRVRFDPADHVVERLPGCSALG